MAVSATLRSRLFRVLAAAAAVACLPLLLSGSSVAADAASTSLPRTKRGLRRRGLRQRHAQGRQRNGPSHLALLDPSDFAHLLREDAGWSEHNIPFLDFDDAVEGGTSLIHAYYFRWRVFRRHLQRTTDDGGASGGAGGNGVQCCAGDASECVVVGPSTGWCSGGKSEDVCHRRRLYDNHLAMMYSIGNVSLGTKDTMVSDARGRTTCGSSRGLRVHRIVKIARNVKSL